MEIVKFKLIPISPEAEKMLTDMRELIEEYQNQLVKVCGIPESQTMRPRTETEYELHHRFMSDKIRLCMIKEFGKMHSLLTKPQITVTK